LIIVLKASLKWVPIVGPAMQIFRFIFMQRNWAADQKNLGLQLKKLGERASRSMQPFVLLICKRASSYIAYLY
jgi:1-acyl-sn-glycerol-3-phosphate acyltransferase